MTSAVKGQGGVVDAESVSVSHHIRSKTSSFTDQSNNPILIAAVNARPSVTTGKSETFSGEAEGGSQGARRCCRRRFDLHISARCRPSCQRCTADAATVVSRARTTDEIRRDGMHRKQQRYSFECCHGGGRLSRGGTLGEPDVLVFSGKRLKFTSAMGSKISSKLIFASCV